MLHTSTGRLSRFAAPLYVPQKCKSTYTSPRTRVNTGARYRQLNAEGFIGTAYMPDSDARRNSDACPDAHPDTCADADADTKHYATIFAERNLPHPGRI